MSGTKYVKSRCHERKIDEEALPVINADAVLTGIYHGIETVTVQEGEPRCCAIDKDLEGSGETELEKDVREGSKTGCQVGECGESVSF
jgi:hypothetical protein